MEMYEEITVHDKTFVIIANDNILSAMVKVDTEVISNLGEFAMALSIVGEYKIPAMPKVTHAVFFPECVDLSIPAHKAMLYHEVGHVINDAMSQDTCPTKILNDELRADMFCPDKLALLEALHIVRTGLTRMYVDTASMSMLDSRIAFWETYFKELSE